MAKAYIMCGLAGSGKSTWIKNNLPSGIPVVSRDRLRAQLGFTKSEDEKAVLSRKDENFVTQVQDHYIQQLCQNDSDFVLDNQNTKLRFRKQVVDMIRQYPNMQVVMVKFNTPVEKCVERRAGQIPADIMRSMGASVEAPTEDECDELIDVPYKEEDIHEGLRSIINQVISEVTRKDGLEIGSTITVNDKNKVPHDYTKVANAKPHTEANNFTPQKKTIIGYKRFAYNPKFPNVVFPLYINTEFDAKHKDGLKIGQWYNAGEGELYQRLDNQRMYTPSKLNMLAYRAGWHLTSTPLAGHIGRKSKETGKVEFFNDDHVWAECEICCDDDSWQAKADASPDGYVQNVPKNGMYIYKTNAGASDEQEWYIADKIRINKILTDDESDQLVNDYYGDTPHKIMPREGGWRMDTERLRSLGLAESNKRQRK